MSTTVAYSETAQIKQAIIKLKHRAQENDYNPIIARGLQTKIDTLEILKEMIENHGSINLSMEHYQLIMNWA